MHIIYIILYLYNICRYFNSCVTACVHTYVRSYASTHALTLVQTEESTRAEWHDTITSVLDQLFNNHFRIPPFFRHDMLPS